MNSHDKFQLTKHLVKADAMIAEARMELIKASHLVPNLADGSPDDATPEERELHQKLVGMYKVLFADVITVCEGGDSKFFNFRELVEQVMRPPDIRPSENRASEV